MTNFIKFLNKQLKNKNVKHSDIQNIAKSLLRSCSHINEFKKFFPIGNTFKYTKKIFPIIETSINCLGEKYVSNLSFCSLLNYNYIDVDGFEDRVNNINKHLEKLDYKELNSNDIISFFNIKNITF